MSSKDAYFKAMNAGMDLVCVSPNAPIPVCKIMDYGKYKFDKQKHERLAKKNQQNSGMSEVQISYVIQEHDLLVKAKTAQRLIEKGNSVRIVLRLRGREMSFVDAAKEKVKHLIELCSEFSKVRKDIYLEGRDLKVIIEKK